MPPLLIIFLLCNSANAGFINEQKSNWIVEQSDPFKYVFDCIIVLNDNHFIFYANQPEI